jgi:hypothetical protein
MPTIMRQGKRYIHIFILNTINILMLKKVPLQNNIKRISLGSKYISIPINISSWSASSRTIINTWTGDTELKNSWYIMEEFNYQLFPEQKDNFEPR